jgi:two-component system cell cycle sensor histidine kinase/response regulator CckA
MTIFGNSKWRRTSAFVAAALAGALACLGIGVMHHRRDVLQSQTPFRIGFFNTPIEHFPGSDGIPVGNTIDLMNDAARRAGIKLEWVYSPEGTDAALESGQVDLWPTMGDLPERKGRIYISAPWSVTEYGLVYREGEPTLWDTHSSDVTLAVSSGTVQERLTRRNFPNAKFLLASSTSEQLNDVCTGKAQAAVITQNFDQSTLPENCSGVPLHMADEPGFSVRFGIGASYRRPGAVQAADALRKQLGAMAADGSLVDTEFRWLDPALPQTRAVFYLLAAERSERLLAAGSILLGAVLIVLLWFIVARRRTADALKQERRLLRTLIDNMPDRIYVKDAGSRWVVANRALAELVGVKNPRELIGKTDFDFWPKELAARFFSDEKAILRTGKPLVNHIETVLDPHGNSRWTSTTKVPWHDKQGRVIGIMGIGRDITERKSAEEKFHKAFNASPEPITITSVADGRYIDANESFLRVTGYTREELIGRTSLELGFWENAKDRAAFIDELRRTGSARDIEIPFRTKSGERRIGLHSAGRIELGGQECIICSQKDITEQKALEHRLRQAQKMEAVGQLSGGIAHDFNNLLGVIIGYSEILEENLGKDDKLQKNVGEIKRAGQRAASLTRQLLAFSRQQLLEPRVLNLNKVVAETETMLQRLIGEDIELTSCLGSHLGQVKADPGQIEQVILNLVVNARDAMPKGGRLTIETSNVDLDEEFALRHPPTIPGRYVALLVTDTGIGMDAATQAHIFEPFFTTKDVGKGTGLGLATVYGVVKQSGGCIWVYSEPGIGSTFKIYLPRVDEPVEKRPPVSIPGAAASRRASETVLLVEDEDSLRVLTRTLLEQNGYTVLEAHNGAEAIEVARRHREPIHLLMTDMVMPGMSGPEVAASLASIHPESRVVYISGYASFSRRGMLDSDAVLLQKPFTRDALLSKLREVLDLQSQPQVR